RALHCDLRAALAFTALVDLETARRLLESTLHPDACEQPAILRDGIIPAPLKIEGLYAVGRWNAARGRLGKADEALSLSLELLGEHECAPVDGGELARFLGEIRLDRGDLRGVDSLRVAVPPEDDASLLKQRWTLIFAGALQHRGRLSEAERALGEVHRFA